jgi:hypothetical protein
MMIAGRSLRVTAGSVFGHDFAQAITGHGNGRLRADNGTGRISKKRRQTCAIGSPQLLPGALHEFAQRRVRAHPRSIRLDAAMQHFQYVRLNKTISLATIRARRKTGRSRKRGTRRPAASPRGLRSRVSPGAAVDHRAAQDTRQS